MNLLARATAGLILWGLAFASVYGLEGLGCANGWHESGRSGIAMSDDTGVSLRLMLVTAWLIAISAHGILVLYLLFTNTTREQPFWRRLEISSAMVGMLATIWTLFPVAVLRLCDAAGL